MTTWARQGAWALAPILAAGCAAGATAPPPPRPPPDATILTDAVWEGDLPRMRALLAARADPAAIDAPEWPPWTWTLVTRDRPARQLLLSYARDIHPENPQTIAALRMAVGQGDGDLVRELLRRRVSVNPPSARFASPLLVAASTGDVRMVDVLLDSGAQVNAADGQGDTALMAAVRVGARDCVERLLARGADARLRDHEGRTALAWAREERADSLAALLVGADPGSSAAAVSPGAPPPSVTVAIARSIPLVQRGAAAWTKKVGCSSCHHQPMALLVASVAERANVSFDRALAKELRDHLAEEELIFQAESQKALASDVGVLRAGRLNSGDIAFGTGLFLSARLDAGGLARGGPEETSAKLLARLQLSDGHWRYGPLRGAIESSDIATTALAARVISGLAPIGDDTTARVGRARQWLVRASASSVVDHAYRLYGLHWTAADAPLVTEQATRLRALQRKDGGWGHVPSAPSDAYSTGLALVSLHEAGALAVTDPAFRVGIAYLLERQKPDGTWLVHSRAVPLLPYVDGGSPHGKLQFISFAATCWATMALMYASTSPTP